MMKVEGVKKIESINFCVSKLFLAMPRGKKTKYIHP